VLDRKITDDQEAREDAVSQIFLDIVALFADAGRAARQGDDSAKA